ncbi:MAG: ATP-binding protein [Planctomycetes bacterium]|nr:ATP-binding protein [Planctomycetota bacterium]
MTPRPGEAASEIPRELKLDLPAVHSGARLARHLIRPFARSNGVTGRSLDSLLLVAEELLTNAVDHGGGHAAADENELSEPVRMSMKLTISRGSWEIRVADQGGGDPSVLAKVLHPDHVPDLDDERGRGFFLLSRMVHKLSVEKSDDGRGIQIIAVQRHGEREH